MNPQLLFFLAHFKPGRAALDHQRRNPFFAFRRIGIDVHQRGIGHAAVGDPRFRSVDDVAVALAHRTRRQRRRVRSRLRLGQRVAADLFAAREWREKFFFLLLGPEAMKRIAVQRILHRENDPGRGANARNLFDDDGVGDVVEARAAFGFRQRHCGKAQLRRLAERLAGELPGLVDLARQRFYFAFGEFAHRALQQLLFFAEFEIQP